MCSYEILHVQCAFTENHNNLEPEYQKNLLTLLSYGNYDCKSLLSCKLEGKIAFFLEFLAAKMPAFDVCFADHITSPSAVKLPVKRLIDLCRKHNVISIIDGAHAPGQIQLSMKDLGADFYSGTLCFIFFSQVFCSSVA